VTIYLGDDSPAFILCRTGSFQIRGAKTEANLEETESQFRTLLSEVGPEIPEYEFRHVTSVFVGTFETDVSLNALTIALGLENTEYEPEQFPGLIYRPADYQAVLLIFTSGKTVITGSSKLDILPIRNATDLSINTNISWKRNK